MNSEKIDNFKNFAASFSGCDGGDLGSAEQKAIWLCGLEWGGGGTAESLNAGIDFHVAHPEYVPEGHETCRSSFPISI